MIRRAGQADRPELLRLLSIYKIARDAERRFAWIYEESPEGRAEAWLAIDRAQGDIVGFTSIFPRTFSVDGRAVQGGIGFDAFVRPDRRRLGVAAALHAEAARDMAEGNVPFRFMCGPPAPANLGALLKVGSKIVAGLGFHVRPLRAEGVVDMLHHEGAGSAEARRLATWVDRTRDRLFPRRGPRSGWSVRRVRGPEPALDVLWDRARRELPIVGRRDAALIVWRFLDNPACAQEVVLIEGPSGPAGWAALEHAKQGCLLVDFLLPVDGGEARPALDALVAHVARAGALRLVVRLNPEGPFGRLFRRRGFLPGRVVEELQVLCPDPALARALSGPSRWHFGAGDLNPEATHWSVISSPREAFSNADYVTAQWTEPAGR